jgi:adenosyl cobinamide kinase/adenosyl cobinamide phosphate guanylyltransferase
MILITGENRIGKTTFARELAKLLNLPVYGFADQVREDIYRQIYRFKFHHLRQDDIFKHSDEWVKLLDRYTCSRKLWKFLDENTEVKERLREDIVAYAQSMKVIHGDDYWVQRLFENHDDVNNAIIHDFRFDEEWHSIMAQKNKNRGSYHVNPDGRPIVIVLYNGRWDDILNGNKLLFTVDVRKAILNGCIGHYVDKDNHEEFMASVKECANYIKENNLVK